MCVNIEPFTFLGGLRHVVLTIFHFLLFIFCSALCFSWHVGIGHGVVVFFGLCVVYSTTFS